MNQSNRLAAWLERDKRLIIVLDDDPTGTQTFSEVVVVLDPNADTLRSAIGPDVSCLFILTNTRAMNERDAVSLLRRIKRDADAVCGELGRVPSYILRGDSTLRGHIFAEMDVFRRPPSVGLFVPAFPECGRTTLHGVHYLEDENGKRPVAATEFARDSQFGYRSERLEDWVGEIGSGWIGKSVPIEAIRGRGAAAVADALLGAKPGTVIVPDAENRSDIEAIALGLLMAEGAGCDVVVRSASTFASVRCGKRSKLVRPSAAADRGLLIVCGSHTSLTTRQLARLTAHTGIEPAVVPTERLLAEGHGAVVPALAASVQEQLRRYRTAVLATERVRDARYGDLESGAKVMKALTDTVAAVAGDCRSVISKGGITSAQVAVEGLGAATATVEGQLELGVSLWKLHRANGPAMEYAVIPGNVGTEQTLVHIYECFK